VTVPSFAQLDEQPFKLFHWRAVFTTGMGVFTDGYDLSSIGIVLPLVLTSFGVARVSSIQGAALAGSALVGAALGALLFGFLAQGGRKKLYGIDVTIMAIAAIAQIFAGSLWALIGVRFVLGIGVGADYVLSPTIMAEHANRRDRGRKVGIGFGVMWSSGALAAALLTLGLQSIGVGPDIVWRIVLAFGAVPALSVLYLRRKMPETARYLARLADDAQGAASVVQHVSGERAGLLPGKDERSFYEVFARHAGPIFATALLWMVFDIVAYSGTLFGPSLIAKGLGLSATTFSIGMHVLFGLPGALTAAVLLIDRLGRKPLQSLGFVGAGIMLILFASLHQVVLAVPALGFVLYGLYTLALAGPNVVSGTGILGVELAPTRVRTIGQAISVAGGRIGASITAFLFPLVFAQTGVVGAIYTMAAFSLLGAALTALLIPETAGRSLEELNNDVDEIAVEEPATI
jgi:MFS family permease